MPMMQAPTLFLNAPAPVMGEGDALRLDVKFVEGMRLHAALWPGPVQAILRRGAAAIPFGATYRTEDLGFGLTVLDPGAPLAPGHLQAGGVLLGSADVGASEAMVRMAQGLGMKVVLALEYTIETRLQILRLERGRNPLRLLRGLIWEAGQERHRRAALRAADAVQFNGYPAYERYRAMCRQPMLYLDGRMSAPMMARPDEVAARQARLAGGAPLRLIHSGRLEALKGAQDLLPVMAALRQAGVKATLDIYGAGSLRDQIAAGLGAFDGAVRLHDPVDFATALVPAMRQGADLFLSAHRQSDPSCSYIEAMGCGLPVAGYDNAMLSRLVAESGGGVCAPMGDVAGLAAAIAAWDRDRDGLAAAAARALSFAQAHDFETEFAARMAHLRQVAGV